jgi:predicted nucleic acid-binding protein
MEMKADLLLMDEILGRGEAGRISLKTTGCIGILLQAKSKKLIPAIRPILEQLESEAGFYLSQEITDYALELAGE